MFLMGSLLLLVLLLNNDTVQEGMSVVGSALDYKMGKGIVLTSGEKPWDVRKMAASRGSDQAYPPYNLPPNRMAIFDDLRFAPECCPSRFTNTLGCACAPANLKNYVNSQRGGNNTKSCSSF